MITSLKNSAHKTVCGIVYYRFEKLYGYLLWEDFSRCSYRMYMHLHYSIQIILQNIYDLIYLSCEVILIDPILKSTANLLKQLFILWVESHGHWIIQGVPISLWNGNMCITFPAYGYITHIRSSALFILDRLKISVRHIVFLLKFPKKFPCTKD